MKFATLASIAFAVVVALAPSALAQEQVACEDLRQVFEESLVDFDDITGKESKEPGIFFSTYKLPGADNCGLQLDVDSILHCWWRHDSADAAAAAYEHLVSTLDTCFESWAAEPLFTSEPELPEGVIAHHVRSISDEWGEAGSHMLVHVAAVKDDAGGTVYEVWYELGYFLL